MTQQDGQPAQSGKIVDTPWTMLDQAGNKEKSEVRRIAEAGGTDQGPRY